MIKTRSLPCNKGKVDDLLRWNTTHMSYDRYWPSHDDAAAWTSLYEIAKTKRSGTPVNVSSYIGTEVLNTESGKGRQNPCFHTKVGVVNIPYLLYQGSYTFDSRRYLAEYYRLSPFPSVTVPQVTKPAVDFSAAKRRAYRSMRPRFDGDISMINFLFELKDFRDIAKALPKLYSRMHTDFASTNWRWWLSSVDHLQSDVANMLRKGIVEPTRPAAEMWLIYQFAISPLMRDIASMVGQATTTALEAQALFKKQGLQEQTSHYSEKVVHAETGTVGSKNYYCLKFGQYSETKYTATCKYLYDYALRNKVDAFMRYWGLGGSFEAFWNMIPFSFLADYVIQIGKSIHAMERDPNVLNWQIKSWTDSEKFKICNGWYIQDDPRTKVWVIDGVFQNPLSRAHGKLLCGVEGSIYDRRVSQPTIGLYVPKLKGPSLKQWISVAALARCFF